MTRKEIDTIDYLKEAFREDAELTMKKVYTTYRTEFIGFARRHQLTEDDILDAYQDALIALYQNLVAGKITHSSSSVKTYLFGIGKHKLLNILKRQKNTPVVDLDERMLPAIKEHETAVLSEAVTDAIALLGDSCRQILTLFYYRKYSIEAIMTQMQMKNENTVKATKSRCLKQLKKLISKSTL